MEHTSITPEEAADRLAIRELIDAYAHCADRRDAEGQKALFTEDTHFLVYMNGFGTEASEELHGREQLTAVFAALKQYEVTMHFNGQSTLTINGDRTSGETYCIAHHVFRAEGERKIMLAYLRYLDTFVKQSGTWLFAERNLYLEFSDTRALGG
jgi:SnoaL-like domain